MIRAMFAVVAVVLAAWTFGTTNTRAEEPKEVKMTGTMVCASCALNETKKCVNVLQVKEKEKLVNYYIDDKGNKEEYHEGVCGGAKVENVTITGVVSEKEGKKWIKPSKVDIKK